MLVLTLAASLVLQDAEPAPQSGGNTQVAAESDADAPAPTPTDAPALIEQIESRYAAYGDLVAEMAARKARERYYTGLLLPVITRDNLDEGAQGEILQATRETMTALERANTQWAVEQLDPDRFATLYSLEPRLGEDILRFAERDDAALGRIVAALEPAALDGIYDAAAFAEKADNLAVAEGRPQPYGTQTRCVDGTVALYDIAEPDALGDRRRTLGLDALDRDAVEGADCAAAPIEE
ncbi:hypothetical protein [Maricaulis sp.]|uniref:hypothetical protein n=1 Tax=Maricaulis sp. TaxID=1486257 RepID=UPI00262EC590|nr:hypothetical protein [Maricaulis sp.]